MEERRQRTDADPDGQLYEKFADRFGTVFFVDPCPPKYGDYRGGRYRNGHLGIFATVRNPHKIDKLTGAIDSMIDDLKKVPVTDWELRKVKNQLQADFIRRQSSNEGLAGMLSYCETILGDWRYIVNYGKNIENITPEDLRDTANRYLTPDNRTIAIMKKD